MNCCGIITRSNRSFLIAPVLMLAILSSSVFQQVSCQTGQDVYKVQVASSLTKMEVQQVQKNLKLTEAVTEHVISGRYKYFVGNFSSFKEAQKHLANVPVQGAFVVKIPGETAVSQKTTEVKTTQAATPPTQSEQKKDVQKTAAVQESKAANTMTRPQTEKVIALQIAASKDFINPKTFKEKYKLNEEVCMSSSQFSPNEV